MDLPAINRFKKTYANLVDVAGRFKSFPKRTPARDNLITEKNALSAEAADILDELLLPHITVPPGEYRVLPMMVLAGELPAEYPSVMINYYRVSKDKPKIPPAVVCSDQLEPLLNALGFTKLKLTQAVVMYGHVHRTISFFPSPQA